MKKQVLLLSLFIFPFLIHAQQQWVDFTRTTPQSPIIQLVSSDSTEVEFDVEVCGMYETDTTVNSTDFQRIIIPGGGLTTVIGEPEMPYIRQLIAIPECDSVTLSVTVTDTSSMQDYYVYPAPDFEEVYGQDSIIIIQEVFDFDTTAYSTDQSYPQVNAEIKSIGYFRDQKYAEVFIYPIQFNPVSEEILVNEEYEITLTFANPSTSINANVGIFNNIATNTMLNHTSTGVSAIVNDNVSQNGTVEWVTLDSVNQASSVEGDYLIICSDSLWDSTDPDSEVLRIATHRATYNGFDVAILNVENILDLGFDYDEYPFIKEQKMRSCIKLIYEGENAQNTQDGKLGYVLLVGDVNAINEGLPTSKDHEYSFFNDKYPSDYYFSCITELGDEFDLFGDLFIGRFAVENDSQSDELYNLVEKTIHYEHEYSLNNWKRNVLHTNQEQFIPEGGNYKELYLEFIEEIVDDNQQLDALIEFIDGDDYSGNPIKSYVRDELNEGVFFFTHLGHGTEIAWCDTMGDMNISYLINQLSNTGEFPFVFSKSCATGWFDRTFDCLGEALTTYSDNKGFVGFLGAGRPINGAYIPPIMSEPAIQETVPYSVWNEDGSFITGEFILEAKILDFRVCERFWFNYFGDPALNLLAEGFEVSRDVTTTLTSSISKEIFLRDGNMITVPSNNTLTFENDAKLIIEEGATLKLENNATLSAINGLDSLIIYGDLIVGDTVTFESGAKAEFVIDIRNSDLIESISHATFDNITLIAYAKALAFRDSTFFEDCSIEFHRTANNQYFLDSCYFDDTPVEAKRVGSPSTNLGTIEITRCEFDNDKGSSVIYVEGFPNFQITDNELSYSVGDGISLYYSGSATGTSQEVSNNTVEFTGNTSSIDAHGIKVYSSHADLKTNHVFDNKTGLACLQRSSISLKGNSLASTENATQRIQNNSDYQVYSDGSSFPYDFEYNSIYDDQASTYYVYMDTCLFTPYDIENNYWGDDFDEEDNLEPWNAYDYTPEWQPTWGSLKSGNPAQDLFYSAQQNVIDSLYSDARVDFKEVIEEWPESKYVTASVKELLGLAYIHGQDYSGLQEYLESVETLWEDEETIQVTEYVINWCDVCMGNYPDAIDWFEDRILDPLSYEDSICSIIDLGYVYTLMEESGNRWFGYTGQLDQFIPESRESYEKNRELLINLIPKREESAQVIYEDGMENSRHLLKVYPNPVNDVATIEYNLNEDANVVLKLTDIKGNLLQILVNSRINEGLHTFNLDTKEFANGLYFITFEMNGNIIESEMILLSK